MSIKAIKKATSDVRPLYIDWRPWLLREAEQLGSSVTIASVTWTGSGVNVLDTPPPALVGETAGAWIGGGTADTVASVTCRITTNAGHDVSRTITVTVTA